MKKTKIKVLIKPSLSEESLENWVWVNNLETLPRGFIKIKNPINKKSIIVFKRDIDDNYINIYNSKQNTQNIESEKTVHLIVINEYYRNFLNIDKNTFFELEFSKAKWYNKILNSNWNHPNPNISSTHILTIVSLIIGLVSLVLAFLPFF